MRKALPERAEAADEAKAEAFARSAPVRPRPPGASFPPEVLGLFRDRLGVDPADVRMREDPTGARALGAEAYTGGREIAFGAGRFAPHSEAGQRLVAHEMAHVAQARPYVQRKALNPEERLRAAIRVLEEATVEFRERVDDVDERGAEAKGLEIVAAWMAVEAASRGFGTTITPGGVDEAARQSLSDVETYTPLSPELQLLFDQARDAALMAVTVQRIPGAPTIDVVPPVSEDVARQLVWQLHQVVEIVRDTMLIIGLLFPPEITEADEFAVLDLLRKHTNPFHHRWIVAMVARAGLGPKLEALGRTGRATYVRDVYRSLMGSIPKTEADPTAEASLYTVLPLERKVVLNAPMRLGELAESLYGSAELWEVGLLPQNRQLLRGDRPEKWLMAGAGLYYEPMIANEAVRSQDALLRMAQPYAEAGAEAPYLKSSAQGQAAVVGNVVTYTVVVPMMRGRTDGFYSRAEVYWSLSAPHSDERADSRDQIRPPNDESSWNDTVEAPYPREVKARVEGADGTSIADLSLLQPAITPEEKLALGGHTPKRRIATPQAYLERMIAQRDAAEGEAKAFYDAEVRRIENSMPSVKGFLGMNALQAVDAVFVGSGDEMVTVRPLLFAGRDTHAFNYAREDAHDYILVDYTWGEATVYRAGGDDAESGVRNLIATLQKTGRYPKGLLRLEDVYQIDGSIPYQPSGSAIERTQTLAMPGPTEENGLSASGVLKGMSTASLVVGVVGVIFLQPEIAGPAFTAAGFLGGAGAAMGIGERVARGEFEWNLETAMDILDIATAALSAGILAEARFAARGIGQVTLTQKIARGADLVQLGIVGGVHTVAIVKAIASGDPEQILAALGEAIRDGAVILVVHRSAKALSTMPRNAFGPDQARRTAFGVGDDDPFSSRPHADAPSPAAAKPTTHDAWTKASIDSGLAPRAVRAPEPVRAGDPPAVRAEAEYESALAATGYKVEVGVYRNRVTGEYAVRRGTEFEVSGPFGREWEGVMHYHPNPENVLSFRMPAPADVSGAGVSAFFGGRPVTEFVEYPLPGGRRGRTAYTVEPPSGRVRIVYERVDGTRVDHTFSSLQEYAKEYGSRTVYLEKGSRQHQWAMADLKDYYDNSWSAPARRTATGAAPPAPEPQPSGRVAQRTEGYEVVPMEGQRMAEIEANPGPQNLGQGEVLHHRSGLSTWRDVMGRTWSEHPMGKAIGRKKAPSYNEDMPPAADFAAAIAQARPGWNPNELDWAHGVGQSYGIESPVDLMLAPRFFNQRVENIFTEGFDRALYKKYKGNRLVRTVTSTPIDPNHPQLSLVLAERSYRMEVVHPDGTRRTIYEVSLRPSADGTLDMLHLTDTLRMGPEGDLGEMAMQVFEGRKVSKSLTERMEEEVPGWTGGASWTNRVRKK